MNILYFIMLISLVGCTSDIEIKDVKINSGYLDKEYSTKLPLVYINNLPHHNNVSKYIAMNTDVLFSTEATKLLSGAYNNCSNCIDKERLVRPIRISYVPEGTKFRVIGEFIFYQSHLIWGESSIHYLLLEDKSGNVSEIPKYSFDDFFMSDSKYYNGIDQIQSMIMFLKLFDNDHLKITFCPNYYISKNQNVERFINDFSLGDEVSISNNEKYCQGGRNLIFTTQESYLTSRYYFSEWGLYGDWHLL